MKFRLEWLGQYLPGDLPDLATLRRRLTDVGFIVEGTEGEAADAVLEVELTANRPDGMNHRGLAREAACALGREFRDAPAPAPAEGPPTPPRWPR
jgi:phenylalanyl-tRNA synthetase beta subunit